MFQSSLPVVFFVFPLCWKLFYSSKPEIISFSSLADSSSSKPERASSISALTDFSWAAPILVNPKTATKIKNTVTNKVKGSVSQKEEGTESVVEEIIEEKEIEEEIEIIEEKKELEKNIIKNQQKLAEINFIGKSENIIFELLGKAQLSRIDG